MTLQSKRCPLHLLSFYYKKPGKILSHLSLSYGLAGGFHSELEQLGSWGWLDKSHRTQGTICRTQPVLGWSWWAWQRTEGQSLFWVPSVPLFRTASALPQSSGRKQGTTRARSPSYPTHGADLQGTTGQLTAVTHNFIDMLQWIQKGLNVQNFSSF